MKLCILNKKETEDHILTCFSIIRQIRAKEAANVVAELTRNPKEEKRLVMMKRLPDLIRIIRSYP